MIAMVRHFRQQVAACAGLGSPLYAGLLDRVVEDIEGGGVAVEVLAGHEDDPGPSALALRLLGSVHRLVLNGQAPELAAFYPSVGGQWNLQGGWEAFEDLLRTRRAAVREWLDRPPQTNEVGRAAALMGGLLRLGESFRLPVRLFETGASAGLNLRADQYFYTGPKDLRHGPSTSPVRLEGAWQGRPLVPWPDLRVVERVGCDVMPVDVSSEDGRTTLMSYVWPDQTDRLDRLRGAVEVARAHPVEVRRQDAVSFVRDLELVEGAATVLWHSVMWQYLCFEDQAAVTATVDALGARATPDTPFAHLFLEPTRRTPDSEHEFLVVMHLWPEGERHILGTCVAHGIPTTWE